MQASQLSGNIATEQKWLAIHMQQSTTERESAFSQCKETGAIATGGGGEFWFVLGSRRLDAAKDGGNEVSVFEWHCLREIEPRPNVERSGMDVVSRA